jgi:5-methylcytosine-specific restriction endonuclease McrA
MTEIRRRAERLYGQFYVPIVNEGICVYCGELGVEKDHFVPLTRVFGITTGLFILPACKDCNAKAGNKLNA